MHLVKDDGSFAYVDMVDISHTGGGYRCYKWLWEPMGVSRFCWNKGCPGNLPLLNEIQASVLHYRFKRTRSGGFVDLEGRPIPRLLTINVRGRDLQAVHDPRKMIIDLLSMENMTWFLAELLQDLQQTPLAAVADAAHPWRPCRSVRRPWRSCRRVRRPWRPCRRVRRP